MIHSSKIFTYTGRLPCLLQKCMIAVAEEACHLPCLPSLPPLTSRLLLFSAIINNDSKRDFWNKPTTQKLHIQYKQTSRPKSHSKGLKQALKKFQSHGKPEL